MFPIDPQISPRYGSMTVSTPAWLATKDQIADAKQALDKHTFEAVQWHFHASTGSPFWLEKKAELKFDPLKEVRVFDDLKKFPEPKELPALRINYKGYDVFSMPPPGAGYAVLQL